MSTVQKFRCLSFIPANGKGVQFEYTSPHVISDEECTIFENDADAIIALAAAICFWALAAKFAQSTDSTFEADVVDYQRISDTYIELAKGKMTEYRSLMGIGDAKETTPANAGVSVKDLDMGFAFGDEYLIHPSDEH